MGPPLDPAGATNDSDHAECGGVSGKYFDSEIVFSHTLSPTHYEPMGLNVKKTSTFLFMNFGPQNFQGL